MILFCNKAKKKTKFQLAYNESVYKKVSLVNEDETAIIETIKDKMLNVEGLDRGTYFLRFYSTETNFTTRRITIE